MASTIDNKTYTLGQEIIFTGTHDTEHSTVTIDVSGNDVSGNPVSKSVTGKVLSGTYEIPLAPYESDARVIIPSGTLGHSYIGLSAKRLPDGRLVVFWVGGDGHASNSDNLYISISETEYFEFDPTDAIVISHASYGVRNVAMAVDPDTDRIFVFYRVYDAVGATTINVEYVYTDDYFETISSATNISTLFADAPDGIHNPFQDGFVVNHSGTDKLGIIIYGRSVAWAIYLQGDGVTWGERATLYSTSYTSSADALAEPVAVNVDKDRVVLIIRDNGNPDSFIYCKSSDGMQTFDALSSPVVYHSGTVQTANAGDACVVGDDVLFVFFARRLVSRLITTRVNKEAFFTDPKISFDVNTTYDNDRQEIYQSRTNSSTYAINAGNPFIVPHISNGYTAHIVMYEQAASLGEDDTEGMYITFPRLGEGV